jgi:hypothetical protein
MFKKATYVSEWDNGVQITSDCLYNPETKEVKDIESVNVDDMDLDILEREFVFFDDEEIEDFIDLDNPKDEN